MFFQFEEHDLFDSSRLCTSSFVSIERKIPRAPDEKKEILNIALTSDASEIARRPILPELLLYPFKLSGTGACSAVPFALIIQHWEPRIK